MRKLASVRKIIAIDPIPGADAIECATVDGWKVVVKKDEFKVGQLAVYFEIDSWIPTEIASFLSKGKEPREYNGIKGERLRTVKLRGQLSQGLIVPLTVLAPDSMDFGLIGINTPSPDIEGTDVSDILNIQKYDPPVSAQLSGVARGNFPSFIPKTDQERIQNLRNELEEWVHSGYGWEVTEKLDGSSMTVYMNDGVFGVCSRNLDLIETESNSFWLAARKYKLDEILTTINQSIAIQGELIGPGIQGNPYELTEHEFRIFDIYNIKEGRYLYSDERFKIVECFDLQHSPVLYTEVIQNASIPMMLADAEGKSQLNQMTEREGLVYKCLDTPLSFKVISNKFLLNER